MGKYDYKSVEELRIETEILTYALYQFHSAKIQINSSKLDFSSLVNAIELIHERLSRIEQTGIIERLAKAEVMK